MNAIPEVNRTSDDPPALEDSLKVLKTRFDKKSLISEEWSLEDNDKAKPSFDDYGNRVSVTIPPQGNVLDLAVAYQPQKGKNESNSRSQQVTPSAIDEISKRLDALTLALTGRQNVQNFTPQGQASAPRPTRCFICGNPCGPDGVHPTGPRFCPETSGLMADHLMTYDTQRGRYILPDGNDLPRTPPGWAGGVASYLRHLRTSSTSATVNSGTARDEPPHMRSTHAVGLMYNDTEVLGGDNFGLNAVPYDYAANPATRSGLDTSNRVDPKSQVNRPDRYKNDNQAPKERPVVAPRSAPSPSSNSQPSTQPVQQPPTQQVRFAPAPTTIPAQPQVNFPPPTNPINTEQGWQGSGPGNQRGGNKDVEMQDAEAKRNNAKFQRATKHGIKRISPHIADNFIDDLGVKGPRSRYNNESIPGNPNIRRFIFEYIQ